VTSSPASAFWISLDRWVLASWIVASVTAARLARLVSWT
jgi:hypothetical protein